MRTQMEVDQDRRRATGASTGSSTPRAHLGDEAGHAEKIAGPGRGRAQPERLAADPSPHRVPSERPHPTGERPSRPAPRRDVRPGALTEEQRVVVEAAVDLLRAHDVLFERADDPGGAGPTSIEPRAT